MLARAMASPRPMFEAVQHCLRDGSWVPSQDSNWSSVWRHLAAAARRGRHHSEWFCSHDTGTTLEWHGQNAQCARLVHDPVSGSFDGVYEARRPFGAVSLFVLSDSLGAQIEDAIRVLRAANVNLEALRFARWDRAHAERNTQLDAIPSTVLGSSDYLRGIDWDAAEQPRSPAGKAEHRIVIAMAGTHYNTFAMCRNPDFNPPDPRMASDFRVQTCANARFFFENHTHPLVSTLRAPPSHWRRGMESRA
eukprot:1975289-Prymnesium_polylepis.1